MAEKIETVEKFDEIAQDASKIEVVKGSEAFNAALLKEPPALFAPRTIALFLCCLVGCFCQTMNGFDGSLFGALTANKEFLDHFHGTNDGIWAGIVSSMYQIGSVVALPFIGPAIDLWGRRVGMFIGSVLIVLGTVVTGLTLQNASVNQFMGGRFLLGFGVGIASAAGPIYVCEMAHPAYRGVVTAYCNTFWFTGSIIASGAVRGALNQGGSASWQIPIWLQMLCSSIIILTCFFIPESPRWLYVHNKQEKAKNVLTKWHGYGNPESAWVQLQLSEYEESLELNGTDKSIWDYRALFRTRSSRYRLLCNCSFAIFAQWAGNGVLTYFLPAVLDTAGYHSSITQTNINLGYACFQYVFALIGAGLVEKVGRRPMMIGSMGACCIAWICVTTSTGVLNSSGQTNDDAARSTLAFIFLFGAVFSFGITPLQALYPVEVLSYEMRAKGMAFCNLAVAAGGLLNQFAWPVSLQKIGWKTYIIFIIWDAVQTAWFYFVLPETKKRTLEELDQVFEARNPVKASLQAHKLAIASDNTVLAAEVA